MQNEPCSLFGVTDIILINVTWSGLCLNLVLLFELSFPAACHGPNSLTFWFPLVIGAVMAEAYCFPPSFAVKILKGPTSLVIGRDLDKSPPQSWADVPERCTTCSMYNRKRKVYLAQRSHLTLPTRLKFFPVNMLPAPSRFLTFLPIT